MSRHLPEAWEEVQEELHSVSSETLTKTADKLLGVCDWDDPDNSDLLILGLRLLVTVELADRARAFNEIVADIEGG